MDHRSTQSANDRPDVVLVTLTPATRIRRAAVAPVRPIKPMDDPDILRRVAERLRAL